MIFAAILALAFTGVPQVVDGDTLKIDGRRLRLAGIDAPESLQTCTEADRSVYPCGRVSTQQMVRFVAGRDVTCRGTSVDRYRRPIVICFARDDPVSLNEHMVLSGQAIAAYGHRYDADQAPAQDALRGLWRAQFEAPAQWRREHRR